MTKTLIAVAISAALAVPVGALADDNATMWPEKAKPAPGQTQQQKNRRTSRADEAMSGNSAAASGSTRPAYDDPSLKPTPPTRAPADRDAPRNAQPTGR